MSLGVPNGGVVDTTTVRPYILVLMSTDAASDPRLQGIAALCGEIGRTDVFAVSPAGRRAAREYDGITFVERLSLDGEASRGITVAPVFRRVTRLAERCRRAAASGRHGRLLRRSAGFVASTLAAVSALTRQYVVAEVLRRRARAVSIAPRIAVCHDAPTLLAGVRLRKRHGCSVVYIRAPAGEGDGAAHAMIPWAEARLRETIERRLLRRADFVVTLPAESLDRAACRAVVERAVAGGAARA